VRQIFISLILSVAGLHVLLCVLPTERTGVANVFLRGLSAQSERGTVVEASVTVSAAVGPSYPRQGDSLPPVQPAATEREWVWARCEPFRMNGLPPNGEIRCARNPRDKGTRAWSKGCHKPSSSTYASSRISASYDPAVAAAEYPPNLEGLLQGTRID
jgi:hypothetical protein